MENTTAEHTSVEIVPAISPETETERNLADEIRQLWAVHVAAKTTVRQTREELKTLRQRLGERLCAMKLLLAKPGRNGGWSSFLRSQGIAKATADRLVRKHEETTSPHPNIVSEEISEPSRDDVGRFLDALWPKMERKLPTPRSAYYFLWWFIGYSGLPYEMQKNGILVINPTADSQKESSGATVAAPMAEMATGAADATGSQVM
jgi:hypothetical protein